ncbi:GNAT family N-acetyltransferase [Zobellia alginiliquefaciens]|uniref:GNAT family N-acetyltransferase n=1 Tax=Zobellia alginiliquefaciens TaxID=3032586 RepID=UPI0023E36761|nr:GNAT family N-acetyltransferase [Zobellia alginiliquefaciens]
MHKLTVDLYLKPITIGEYQQLYDLMCTIYPPAYSHLWPDKGASYINSLYAKENLEKELGQPNSEYFFITYKNEKAGILKVLLNESLPPDHTVNGTKLQRIYLDQSLQGKGIGKALILWVEREYRTTEKSTLWLEVMDTQDQALRFYEKLGFKKVNSFSFDSDFMHEAMRGMYRMAKEI